ncbi:MAG TPA: DUF222 domain-containing protein [Trebonia sp.]
MNDYVDVRVPLPRKPAWDVDRIPCDTEDPMAMPVEHLEARICALAGHLTAATCQFLQLVADYDERAGWAASEMGSCAAWLAWKCQLAPGTAREQVRVARALRRLPVIRAEFAAGRLSYAKVRALTRIAAPETETELVEFAMPMTAGQLERFARAHRQVTRGEADGRPACREPKLTWRQDSSGIAITAHLPHPDGAVVLQALRAWLGDLDHPHDPGPGDETRAERLAARDERDGIDWDADHAPWQQDKTPAGDLAAAMVAVCGEYLSGRAAAADNPDSYQVIIHAGTGALAGAPAPGESAPGVSAETPPAPQPGPASGPTAGTPSQQALEALKQAVPLLTFPETHPAYPWRSHVEDGGAVDLVTLQMIACNATISAMLHDENGNLLDAGRRTRKPSAALRRAVRERDRYRCRFPGCESRRVDLHHIRFWANGGHTSLENLICLCKRHHRTVHDTGIIIAAAGGTFTFYLADGTPIPNAPPLPGGSANGLKDSHDADLDWHTIIPPDSGERLDLQMAIWICFHNTKVQTQRRELQEQRRQGQVCARVPAIDHVLAAWS